MLHTDRHTEYRWLYLWPGILLLAFGAGALGYAITMNQAGAVAGDLALGATGWGALAEVIRSWAAIFGYGLLKTSMRVHSVTWLAWGGAAWLAGWVVIGTLGMRRATAVNVDAPPSEAVGAKLYAPLERYKDFYWSTFVAYAAGILLAELAFILVHSLLSGGVSVKGAESSRPALQTSPVVSFLIALLFSAAVAFVAGYFGASRARRLSGPEATLGIVYFGLPIPILLSIMPMVPWLLLNLGWRLRPVVELAGMLGRPELGYWLVFAWLVLWLLLGIISGFVAAGSGRTDLRTGFELFVARRHVSVFRPRLLLGALAVLLLGIIPPLLIFAIIRAAEAAVERTRIRSLGMEDPLKAATALNAARLKEQTPTEMMTALSVGGVGVGVMALIVVMSVMNGFELDLQKKILGTNAHGIVLKYADDFSEYREVAEKVREVDGVTGVTPFILSEVMLTAEGNVSGAIIKGIEPRTVGQVTALPDYIVPGGLLEYLEYPEQLLKRRLGRDGVDEQPSLPESPFGDDKFVQPPTIGGEKEKPLPGIIVGRELAQSLRVVVGDRVNVVSPLGGGLGPQGPMPKSRPFRVAALFHSGMYEYDSKFVYIKLEEAQDFFGIKGATGLELKVADIDDAKRIAEKVYDRLDGYPYRTNHWGELNRSLFSALRLEKLVMGIILSIIVIVAAGLIVATVIMLVLEKRKEISVLKALGVPDGGIVKIFLAEGLQIGVAGGLLGLVAGVAWCLFIEKAGIRLDPEVYYIENLPVKMVPLQTAIPVVIAILVTYLASIYPALKASRVEPVEGLKAE